MLTQDELEAFLADIESGRIELEPSVEPQAVYASDIEYRASNGWTIVIFNDCNQWDYISEVMASDGRTVTFDEIQEMPRVKDYRPSEEAAWRRYRIPGYLRFRCTSCGERLAADRKSDELVCARCQSPGPS